MKITVRRLAIAVAGLATLIVVLVDRGESANSSHRPASLEERGPTPASQQSTAHNMIDVLPRRPGLGRQKADLFVSDGWQPVLPLPSTQVQGPPAPVPPPNPYRFAGSLLHEGKFRTFITDGDRVYEVRAGEELSAQYRVEAVTKDEVVLVYTPLGTRHPIAAKWAFASDTTDTLTGTVTVVMGGPALPLPPGSPLVATASEPTSAAPLPPGSPLNPPVAAR